MSINNFKVLAVIPARGNSKGFPKKNIREICGKPLIAWSIEQAKKSKYIDKIIVSTDNLEIAEISKDYRAEVPFLRPPELATDTSSVTDSLLHLINELENKGEKFDILVELQPTSCIRETKDIDECLNQLENNSRAKSIISVKQIETTDHPDFAAQIDEEGFVIGPVGDRKFHRQIIPKRYAYNGTILASYVEDLKRFKSFHSKDTLGYVLKEKQKTYDINDKWDFIATQAVMKKVLEKEIQEKFDLNSILLKAQKNKTILFGAASSGKRALLNLINKGVEKKNILFYDNNPQKWGNEILGVKVLSLNEFENLPKDTLILITSCMFGEIIPQLKRLSFENFYYVRELLYTKYLLLKYDNNFLRILDDIEETCNMDSEEKYTLYSSMLAVFSLGGDVAEVGVYKGGSAKLLCETKGRKNLYLFDTFEGLPETRDDDLVEQGWLNDTSLEVVKDYLKNYENVFLYKGLFPKTAQDILDKKFCFVHLDTDIYEGTFEGLKFFWPRMIKGGRIISHDYNNNDCPGVKKAFEEFFKDNPEEIIEIADTQGMVIKK